MPKSHPLLSNPVNLFIKILSSLIIPTSTSKHSIDTFSSYSTGPYRRGYIEVPLYNFLSKRGSQETKGLTRKPYKIRAKP